LFSARTLIISRRRLRRTGFALAFRAAFFALLPVSVQVCWLMSGSPASHREFIAGQIAPDRLISADGLAFFGLSAPARIN